MSFNFAGYTITLLFLTIYIIMPIGVLLLSFLKLFSKNKTLKNMGTVITDIDPVEIKKHSKKFLILNFIIFPIFVFLFNKTISLILILGVSQILIDSFNRKKYLKANAIYENGIILGSDSIEFKKIHSYKVLDTTKLSFLQTNGFRFDVSGVLDIEQVRSHLESKDIHLNDN